MRPLRTLLLLLPLLSTLSCGREAAAPEPSARRTPASILLVTLDTTRADSIGPGAKGVQTPSFNLLARGGAAFAYAYATVPQTLPSHSSILTGLYPAGHGVHENARYLGSSHPLVSEKLKEAGYATAAFVSSFVLDRRFGLGRGFDAYDDRFEEGKSERSARDTTDRALAWLQSAPRGPVFLWVHYFDPHAPYEPPEPFRSRYRDDPYRGEVASMDEQLGRLVSAFQSGRTGPKAIIVAGDHGEGLGDHGEAQHGNLLYQSVMRVPLVIAGDAVPAGVRTDPVSIRRIFHTILDFAALGSEGSLREPGASEIVLGEAMKPFLEYGWQPQVMGVAGTRKAILAGEVEVFDVATDPAEARPSRDLSRELRAAIRDYPPPSPAAPPANDSLSEEERRRLASLGYVSSAVRPVIRAGAPRPAAMTHLFEPLDKASGLFVAGRYADAVPLLERILAEDPYNLDSALRLAAANSLLGRDAASEAAFARARSIAPESRDVSHYLAMHYARGRDWRKAVPLLESVLAVEPDRLPSLEALAELREREGRAAEALALRQRVISMKEPSAAELLRVGDLAMSVGNTDAAIAAFERARGTQGPAFRRDLELGVLYLAARRFSEARDALDRVGPSHPAYAMALFKRAQVAVLLGEPDRARRIEAARRHADATTKPLIENETLFR